MGDGRHRQQRPRWKTALFSVLPAVVFFLLLEAALALLGVVPRSVRDDPFVGFSSAAPLFVEVESPDGTPLVQTGSGKRAFFNVQRFEPEKPEGAFRIFCLGGSTTYGRPFADDTAFSGWLRELLPLAAPDRDWQVINVGGISYASYRVALLMEELAGYDPDLFIVYTGHNEFLEERTYGELRELPSALRAAGSLLARTRTWTAAEALLRRTPLLRSPAEESGSLLPDAVKTKLEGSAGPERYERDDRLRDRIVAHFRISLQRMIAIAHEAGVKILFVSPGSNVRDWSPFKSEHTDGLDGPEQVRAESLLARARQALQDGAVDAALRAADDALAADPRSADLHYVRGRALLAAGRDGEAAEALRRSRDEDVCPLRAISSLEEVLREVARDREVPLVDYAASLGPLPGNERFLDHVHPTIEEHGRLALALVERMIAEGWIRPDPSWSPVVLDRVAPRIEGRLDPERRARALANLAMTLNWAGKHDESRRLTLEALASGQEEPTLLMMAGRQFAAEGRADEAFGFFRRAVRADPSSPVIHAQFGLLLAGRRELQAAAGHLFLATLLWDSNPTYHRQLAHVMSELGDHRSALASLLAARRLDPRDRALGARIEAARARLSDGAADPIPPETTVTRYESGYPRTIAQTRPDPAGRAVRDGIWTEWYDRGTGLKGFVDYVGGLPHGTAMSWDADGKLLQRVEYRHGAVVRVE